MPLTRFLKVPHHLSASDWATASRLAAALRSLGPRPPCEALYPELESLRFFRSQGDRDMTEATDNLLLQSPEHPLDLSPFDFEEAGELDLFAEELPEQVNLIGACFSTSSSFSSSSGRWCLGSFSTVNCVISCA